MRTKMPSRSGDRMRDWGSSKRLSHSSIVMKEPALTGLPSSTASQMQTTSVGANAASMNRLNSLAWGSGATGLSDGTGTGASATGFLNVTLLMSNDPEGDDPPASSRWPLGLL